MKKKWSFLLFVGAFAVIMTACGIDPVPSEPFPLDRIEVSRELPITPIPRHDQVVSDSNGRISIRMPEGWVEDTVFGTQVVEEIAGEFGPSVDFMAGRPIPGGYDPNLLVMSFPLPRGTALKELVDEEIRIMLSEIPGTALLDRRSDSVSGVQAEVVSWITEPNFVFPEGWETFQVILVMNNRQWLIQCASSPNLVAEMSQCKDAMFSSEIE